jgi:hypothetical protein
MALGVGGVHEADPQKEVMAPNQSGVHEANATLDVTSPPTLATILVNYDYDQLQFSPSCHEVGSKAVKK